MGRSRGFEREFGPGDNLITDPGRIRELLETRLRRCAHGVKPAADVYLGVGFATVMPGSGRRGRLRIPSLDGKLSLSTSNHEPVDRLIGHSATDFTSEFPQLRHVFAP